MNFFCLIIVVWVELFELGDEFLYFCKLGVFDEYKVECVFIFGVGVVILI